MDTDSKSNDNEKSWEELVSLAKKSEPPADLDVSGNVRRAIASEPETEITGGWLNELTELLDAGWVKPAFAITAAVALFLGWEATNAWEEMTFALDLQLPMLTNIL